MIKLFGGIEDFLVTKHKISNDVVYFIRPEISFQSWNQNLLKFRSSIWSEDGQVISASYPKFFNLEECPTISPIDYNRFNEFKFVEKIDGSTLIVSRYKGVTILRTRGTVDARILPTGHELEDFKTTYLKFFQYLESMETEDRSYIFEWYSPKNKIVINYGDSPIFTLTNIINHKDYSLTKQESLDIFAMEYGFNRPNYYTAPTMSELINLIKNLKDKEGVCVYYNNDTSIRKIKSLSYLKRHAFKSHCTVNSILGLCIEKNIPTKEEFISELKKEFDFECVEYAKTTIDIVYIAINQAYSRLQELYNEINKLQDLSQKEFAMQILSNFNKVESGLLFLLRKNHNLPSNSLQKLIEQYIMN